MGGASDGGEASLGAGACDGEEAGSCDGAVHAGGGPPGLAGRADHHDARRERQDREHGAHLGPPYRRRRVPVYRSSGSVTGVAGVVCAHAQAARRDRPGNHQHARDPVRSRRHGRGARSARARADPPPRGLGRARRPRGVDAHTGGDRRCARASRRERRARSSRSASQTSARRPSSGIAPPASPCTTRSSGRTPAPPRSYASWPASRVSTACGSDVGLPLSTYFSGPKISWILEHVPGARERAERGRAGVREHRQRGCCGT